MSATHSCPLLLSRHALVHTPPARISVRTGSLLKRRSESNICSPVPLGNPITTFPRSLQLVCTRRLLSRAANSEHDTSASLARGDTQRRQRSGSGRELCWASGLDAPTPTGKQRRLGRAETSHSVLGQAISAHHLVSLSSREAFFLPRRCLEHFHSLFFLRSKRGDADAPGLPPGAPPRPRCGSWGKPFLRATRSYGRIRLQAAKKNRSSQVWCCLSVVCLP
jgi:hypothetical protein